MGMSRSERKHGKKKKILIAVSAALLVLIGAALLASDVLIPKSKVKLNTGEAVSSNKANAPEDGSGFLIADDISRVQLENELPLTMKELTMQNTIHFMSHQKVKAEEKWGSVPLTEQRIDRLLAILEAKKFKHERIYRDILMRWKEGDFSQVDRDHNAIWDLQDGTVGKATGILSLEEERAYIEENYDIGK
jgi:hypothetical protein